jgi:16S rRNA G966 N2-methylase RsmD
VEKAERHARAIRHNLAAIHAAPNVVEVRVQDVFVALTQLAASARQFDLVLADPPYGEKNVGQRSRSLAQRLLDDAHLPQVLGPDGLFVLGHTKRDTLEIPPVWQEVKTLKHGDTVMRLLKLAAAARTAE